MKEYRINVRFRLEDDAQRSAAEFLEHLDRGGNMAPETPLP